MCFSTNQTVSAVSRATLRPELQVSALSEKLVGKRDLAHFWCLDENLCIIIIRLKSISKTLQGTCPLDLSLCHGYVPQQ
jgi:hypothetical protein